MPPLLCLRQEDPLRAHVAASSYRLSACFYTLCRLAGAVAFIVMARIVVAQLLLYTFQVALCRRCCFRRDGSLCALATIGVYLPSVCVPQLLLPSYLPALWLQKCCCIPSECLRYGHVPPCHRCCFCRGGPLRARATVVVHLPIASVTPMLLLS